MPDLDKSQTITVSLGLRPMTAIPKPLPGVPTQTPEEFEATHGADPLDIEAIRAFAAEEGLTVVQELPGKRIVRVSGTISQIESAFKTELEQRPTADGEHRFAMHAAPPIPRLGVEAVLGLESAPFAKPHNRKRGNQPHVAGAHPLGPVETARRYGVVQRTTAAPRTLAGGILCLGGGYTISDVAAGCAIYGIPVPTIVDHSVSGAHNSPGSDADVELYLDILQMAGAYFARTGKAMTIHVWFCPNTDAGFVGGCLAATHSGLICVLSISWGSSETNWAAQARSQMDQMAQGAGSLGVTITAATGDDGANDGTNSPVPDYPACSPWILGMGGTALTDTEAAWNSGQGGGAGGGGVSGTEPAQAWQHDYPPEAMSGRCIPDMSCNSDPATCGLLVAQGQQMAIGGTSAAAPWQAGTIVWQCEELPQNIGYLNPLLAKMPAECFFDITQGNNNGYDAKTGPDLVTGRGSPRPVAMLAALEGLPPPVNPPGQPPPVNPPSQPPPAHLTQREKMAIRAAQALGLRVSVPPNPADAFSAK
jgi:kumamolisin